MTDRAAQRSARAGRKLHEPVVRKAVLIVFLALCFLIGGGSRSDIVSLVVLRPLAFAAIAYSVFVLRRGDLAAVRAPLVLLLCLIALIALQLLPLPPFLWRSLPGRELFAQTYNEAGITLPWLPLAMSPSRALNALMSLSVPLAALLLFAIQDPERRADLWAFVWAAALCSVLLGVLQLTGSPRGPLYLYRITNSGLPVGLFANRNHQALLVGISIALAAALVAQHRGRRRGSAVWVTLAIGSIFLFVPFLLITGSRAGLLIGVAMLLPAAWIVYLAFASRPDERPHRQSPTVLRGAFAAGAASIAGLFVAALVFSRSLAFDRLVNSGGNTELRINVLPSLLELLKAHFALGIGFGSFEFAYRRVEPLDLLMPNYLNQAHDDWLQLAIEGGIPAILLLAAFVVWLAKSSLGLLQARRTERDPNALASLAVVLAFGAASLVDYPLRVPSLMAVFAIACAFLSAHEVRK